MERQSNDFFYGVTNTTRRLAAIVFSDIAGYTAIMGRHEQQAIRALAAHRELLRSLLPTYNPWGDGVNIASRIHGLAEPGGICISERVYEDTRNQPEIKTVYLGEKTLVRRSSR